MPVPALGTTRVQHAQARKHTPRARLAPRRGYPIALVPALAWVWLYPGWGAQRGWGGPDPPRTRELLAMEWRGG